jgi:hypothetical protein
LHVAAPQSGLCQLVTFRRTIEASRQCATNARTALIADALNTRGIKTERGGRWVSAGGSKVLSRIDDPAARANYRKVGTAAIRKATDDRARAFANIIAEIRCAAPDATLQQIAQIMNARGVKPARGSRRRPDISTHHPTTKQYERLTRTTGDRPCRI